MRKKTKMFYYKLGKYGIPIGYEKVMKDKKNITVSNDIALKQRTMYRDTLKIDGHMPNEHPFPKDYVLEVIRVRKETMKHFIWQFGVMLNAYMKVASNSNKKKVYSVLRGTRVNNIIGAVDGRNANHYVTIRELFELYIKLDLKKDFIKYFWSKTQLSFSVFEEDPIDAVICPFFHEGSIDNAIALKFSEFIHVILSEYALLHNMMYVSGYKTADIYSIDPWLEDIDEKSVYPTEEKKHRKRRAKNAVSK